MTDQPQRPSLRIAMAAVDQQSAQTANQYIQTQATAAADTAAEAKSRAEDYSADRLALSINVVLHAEQQRGRATISRKGAATVVLIKQMLDAVHAEDKPVTYREFGPGAFGGGSQIDLSAIADVLSGKKDG